MISAKDIVAQFGELARSALVGFAKTLAATLLYGMALDRALQWLAKIEQPWSTGLMLVALCESLAAGVFLGLKRAGWGALLDGLRRLDIARSMTQHLFERVLGIDGNQRPGERGGRVANTVERVPLAQAEQRLKSAAAAVVGAPGTGAEPLAWLRRRLESKLVRMVEFYTLAWFREAGAATGGVDLLKVRDEIVNGIDTVLLSRLGRAASLWTAALVLGLTALIGLQTLLVWTSLKA